MRHQKTGRKLSRRKSHRTAMLANLAASLIKHGRVRTTEAKAKEIRPFVERLITFAKRGTLHDRRTVYSRIRDGEAVQRLFDVIGPTFTNRQGGYTRILKLGFRQGDNSPIALIEILDEEVENKAASKKKPAKKAKAKTEPKKTAPVVEEAAEEDVPVVEAAAEEAAPVVEEVAEEAAPETVEAETEAVVEEAAPEVVEEVPEAVATPEPKAKKKPAAKEAPAESTDDTAADDAAAEDSKK
jgi:large subunit ribosomal protein L17